jgi:signal transduction histidine kinase
VKSKNSSTTYSFRAIKKNGEVFLVEVNEVKTIWEGNPALLEFIRDISERVQAEQHIRILGQQLIKAQETERQKLSRELHDHLAQDLSTLKIGIDTLFNDISDSGALQEVKKKVSEFSVMLKKSIMSVRDLAYELRPPSLGQIDTARTFGVYCEEFAERTGIIVDYSSAGMDILKLDPDIEINLYRLMQESLYNIKKHAQANRVRVRLIASFPHIILSIEDNGRGFNVNDRMIKAFQEKRMGLRSMQERAALLNGKIKILSRLNQGTKIFIEVPYTEKNNRFIAGLPNN